MDLFTIDNVGEKQLLEQNTNENSVKFVTKVSVLKEVSPEDVKVVVEKTEAEEDENLSDVDFGGKFNTL